MRRTCALCVIGAAVLSCAATLGVERALSARHMSVEDAMALVGTVLTPDQRSIVISALRREALVSVRQLRRMTLDDDNAIVRFNALQALTEIEDYLR